MQPPIIIIGGGISGLHLAALISPHAPVVIYEKTSDLGGRAQAVDFHGFQLDFGPHPIRFGALSALGLSLTELHSPIEFIQPGPVQWVKPDGTIQIFPAGGIGSIFRSKFPKKWALIEFMLMLKRIQPNAIKTLLDVPLQQWMDQNTLDPAIQQYLTILSGVVMVNPDPTCVSTGELLDIIQQILKKGSVYYPRGGWATLFTKFRSIIEAHGGLIHLNQKVEEIVVEQNAVKGVRIGSEFIPASGVISTIPIQNLPKLFGTSPAGMTEDLRRRCQTVRPVKGVSIDFCLTQLVTNLNGIFMLEKPIGFGFSPSLLSPEICPPRGQILSFFAPLQFDQYADQDQRLAFFQEFRDIIVKTFPLISEACKYERPLFYEMVDGRDCAIDQHRKRNLGYTLPQLSRFWMTGDSTGGIGGGGEIGHTSVRECFELLKTEYGW